MISTQFALSLEDFTSLVESHIDYNRRIMNASDYLGTSICDGPVFDHANKQFESFFKVMVGYDLMNIIVSYCCNEVTGYPGEEIPGVIEEDKHYPIEKLYNYIKKVCN